jgi:hypothetical protein
VDIDFFLFRLTKIYAWSHNFCGRASFLAFSSSKKTKLLIKW